MKFLFSILLVSIFIISGCSNMVDGTKGEFTSLDEAKLESEIAGDFFVTEEMDKAAFSIYQSENGYGVLHFTRKEHGWSYQGSSGFEYDRDPDGKFMTFSQSTWHKGDFSLNNEVTYATLFLGEVLNPDISKITVEYANTEKEAEIIQNNERTFWYLSADRQDIQEELGTVSAYSSDGKLIYKNEK